MIEPRDTLIVPDFIRPSDYLRKLFRELANPPIAGGASKSDYLEAKLLDHVFNDPSYSAPTPYLALTTVVPTDASTGASITEASYTGYARLAIATSDMGAAASGSKANSATLTFANCTAGSSTIIGFAICDASGTGAGNVLYWGTVSSTVISTTQTPPTVAVGALAITED